MNTPQEDGGPAQTPPHEEYMAIMREANSPETKDRNLRDWFAGMALQGILASGHFTEPPLDDDPAWMTTHSDPYDDETGESIHTARRRFDFVGAAGTCANRMLAARKEAK